MLNLWLLHTSEVSLIEQITTQFRLAILSGELSAGERLPSVRQLARLFGLHHNTVSAAYGKLQQIGLVEFRRGSGVYVRGAATLPPLDDPATLATLSFRRMLTTLVSTAREIGIDADDLQAQIREAYRRSGIRRIVLLEPDAALQEIVLAELRATITTRLKTCALEHEALLTLLDQSLFVALPSKAELAHSLLPAGTPLHVLRIRSAAESLTKYLPAANTGLVGIASGWPPFREIARTMLLASGFHEDTLLLRDTHQQNWARGLEQTLAVVCDAATLPSLPTNSVALPFYLLAESSIAELQAKCAVAPHIS